MEKVINLIDKTNFTELLSVCIGEVYFNADLEKRSPLEYLQYINCAYENMQKYGIQELLSKKIKLSIKARR